MKPRIKKDIYTGTGFTCRSRERGGLTGTHPVIAYGDTPEQAYLNWRKKREANWRRRFGYEVKPE